MKSSTYSAKVLPTLMSVKSSTLQTQKVSPELNCRLASLTAAAVPVHTSSLIKNTSSPRSKFSKHSFLCPITTKTLLNPSLLAQASWKSSKVWPLTFNNALGVLSVPKRVPLPPAKMTTDSISYLHNAWPELHHSHKCCFH